MLYVDLVQSLGIELWIKPLASFSGDFCLRDNGVTCYVIFSLFCDNSHALCERTKHIEVG